MMQNIHTLIVESEWGESKFFFDNWLCLHEVSDLLKSLDFKPDGITESKGIARVYHPGGLSNVNDLESELMQLYDIDHSSFGEADTPEIVHDFCPVLARFASLCNEVNDDKETSSMGGAPPEGTEETKEQSGKTAEVDQLHSDDFKAASRDLIARYYQEQAKAGGDSEHVQTHNAGDEVTNTKLDDIEFHLRDKIDTELNDIGCIVDATRIACWVTFYFIVACTAYGIINLALNIWMVM